MDSMEAEVASVFSTVIIGDRQQINQAINNYKDPYSYNQHRFKLFQARDKDRRNILHYACMYNTDEVATWMLSLKDDYSGDPIPKVRDIFGVTAVMYAARAGMVAFVSEWIKKGVDIKNVDHHGMNILDYCLGLGEMIPCLPDAACYSRKGKTEAIKEVANILSDQGVKPSTLQKRDMTPLEYFDKYLFFIDFDFNIPVKLRKEIHECVIVGTKSKAIYSGQIQMCVSVCFMPNYHLDNIQRIAKFEEMVTNGKLNLNVNETDENGMTALHHLCYYEYDSEPYGLRELLVSKLLELGADPNIKDIRGYTPLMCALEKGYVVLYDQNDPRSANVHGLEAAESI